VWALLEPVFRAGETFPHDPAISEAEAQLAWVEQSQAVMVAVDATGALVGTYYLRPNSLALGAHVANAGYVVAEPSGAVLHHLIHALDRQKLRPVAGMAWLTDSPAATANAPLGWFKTRAVTGGRLGGVAGAVADPLSQVGQFAHHGGELAAQLLALLLMSPQLLLLSQDKRPGIGWP
jgi:hypothetical protein